jgi:hypothetical protein
VRVFIDQGTGKKVWTHKIFSLDCAAALRRKRENIESSKRRKDPLGGDITTIKALTRCVAASGRRVTLQQQ